MRTRKISIIAAIFISISLVLLSACEPPMVDDPNTVSVVILERGYGTLFMDKLAEAYNAKGKNNKVIIEKKTASFDFIRPSLTAGPGKHNYDLYFTVDEMLFDLLARGKSLIPGYDKVYADLSDIYNKVPDGYGKNTPPLKKLVHPYYLDCVTFYEDQKQYFVTWALGFSGIVYNNNLFDKYGLKPPRTTAEMIELMDSMKTIEKNGYAKNKDGKTVYPFLFSGDTGYTQIISQVWWFQYEGLDAFYNFMEGKNSEGIYTPQIYLQTGLRKSSELLSKIINRNGGYVNPDCMGYEFTSAQVKFLSGEAFMMCNGDWLDKEADKHYKPGEVDVKFMKPPVISDILDKLPKGSIKDDATLRKVVDYVDDSVADDVEESDKTPKPLGIDDEDIEYVRQARNMFISESGTHSAFIPSYSNNIEGAKDFLLFMLSKEGQEIMLQYTAGNVSPLMINHEELAGFDKLSNLQKSKFEFIKDNPYYIGRKYNRPMFYRGGLYIYRQKLEDFFGVTPSSNSYKTVEKYMLDNYEYYETNWEEIMRKAGVSN